MARQRLAIAKMLLGVLRALESGYRNPDRFGTSMGERLIMIAALVGQIEQRPLGASKLALLTGIPRPTVIRRLRELERHGLVARSGPGYVLPVGRLNRPEALASVREIGRLIRTAAQDLSKMDT